LLASSRSLTKRAGSATGALSHKYVFEYLDPRSDPYQNVTDPGHGKTGRIRFLIATDPQLLLQEVLPFYGNTHTTTTVTALQTTLYRHEARDIIRSVHYGSVVDPDPVGFETSCRIRI
jgi:hypothetical protein